VKGRRKSFARDVCPIARSIDALGDWWSLLIIRDALHGLRRFGEFQKSLGIAKNILATRLTKLAARGIMQRVPARDGGAHREYVLTDKGERLLLVLTALAQWGEISLFAPGEKRGIVCDRRTCEPLPLMQLRGRDGRLLGVADTVLRIDVRDRGRADRAKKATPRRP
jgi:DNA-binding HxlR family transcriptional regulator